MVDSQNFEITSNTEPNGATVVVIKGQIMTGDARNLTSYFRKLHSRGIRDVIVDLTGITYACSAALAFFISACSGYTKDGFCFNAVFCGVPVNVSQAMESLGLAHLLRIAQDRNSAMKLLKEK